MKRSELKQTIKEAILSEMSQISSIGISPDQIKTLHSDLGLAHDTSPVSVPNKAELKKAITADSPDTNILMALDKESNLYVVEKTGMYERKKPTVDVYKVSTDGSIAQKWTNQTITKGLSNVTDATKFFTAKSSKKYKETPYDRDDELYDVRYRVYDNALKMIQNEFDLVKQQVKSKAIEYLENDDFLSARKFMNRISKPANYSWEEDKPLDLNTLLNGSYWSSRESFKNKIFSALKDRKQEPTIRKRAAQMVRKYADEVRSRLLKEPGKYEG